MTEPSGSERLKLSESNELTMLKS